jgi:hypothetical protein
MRPGGWLDHYVVASIKGQQNPFGDDNKKSKCNGKRAAAFAVARFNAA